MSHEDFGRTEEVKQSSDRNFGLVMAAFFLLVACLPLLRNFSPAAIRWWSLAVSAVFAALALIWTSPLAPLNRLWLKLGLFLHMIVSPIILGLLFFACIMPIGLLMRAFGKDPLRLRREPEAKSYWIMRVPPGPPPDTMKNQF